MSAKNGTHLRWLFLILICLLLATAKVLSSTLEARPPKLQTWTPVRSIDFVATALSQQALAPFNGHKNGYEPEIVGIGYPQIDSETTRIVNLSLANLSSETRIIVGGKMRVDRAHDSVDLLDPEALDRALASRAPNERTVLILPTIFISHRMGKNWITEFELANGIHLQSVILSSLALIPAHEESLSPKCFTSQRAASGLAYDLGCLILNLSRRAQQAELAPSQGWLAIENLSDGETLVAYTLESSSKEEIPDAK